MTAASPAARRRPRYNLVMALLPLLLALAVNTAVAAPVGPLVDQGDALCVPQVQVAALAACPAVGPGAYAANTAQARLPAVIAAARATRAT